MLKNAAEVIPGCGAASRFYTQGYPFGNLLSAKRKRRLSTEMRNAC
jgi:hypothetical protein